LVFAIVHCLTWVDSMTPTRAHRAKNPRVATVRHMLRRWFPIAAVAVSAALALGACGGDDESVSVPTAPTSTPTTQTAPTVTTPTQTAVPPAQTTTQTTTTAPSDTGSGGTAAPSGGSGGSTGGDTANERFKKYCEQNPGACGE
jgi:hypothetical protein